MEPALAPDHWSIQIRRNRSGIDGRGHGDDPQIGPDFSLDAAGHGEGEIGVEAPLVDLVEDHGADPLQEWIALEHLDQDALGDHQDSGR
jgi:hypothetical protein